MSRTKALRRELESVGSEAAWKQMPLEELEHRFVNEMNNMTEERLRRVIQPLLAETFNWWCKKLWDAQDIPPTFDGRPYRESFDRSMGIMQVLKRSLLLRMVVEEDPDTRGLLQQQLSSLTLIMNPAIIANMMNIPEDEDDIDDDDKEDSSSSS